MLRGKKWGLTLTFFLFLGLQAALAQFQVKGMVKDADGAALPGATILEKGTQNGTSSDIDGAYSLQVSGRNAVLQVSFIGYSAQEIAVNGRAEIDIVLEEDAGQLTEVVVTALGVEKKQRSLGYAVSEVQGKAFTEVRENNFGNALAGTVAGLNVSKPASGPAGSSRVVIRGINGLSGDNQPLFVVDGFPIDNSNLGSAGMWGGFDLGDGLSSINPDDIEKVSVLKGSAATALYGNRGRNGVILVTTKKASKNKALGVEVNSNSTFDDILVLFDDYQWEYGAGNNGQRPKSVLEAQDYGNSNWGEKLDGRPAMNPDGVERPYTAHKD
ncbi:MAG: TonB-dependent receptor plug domain-containing protein, partial [Haliscomenobacter sp.]